MAGIQGASLASVGLGIQKEALDEFSATANEEARRNAENTQIEAQRKSGNMALGSTVGGLAGGAIAGAEWGSAAGPWGTLVGAVAGALFGKLF